MNCKVLLVDDDKLFTEQIASLLASESYTVISENISNNVIKQIDESEFAVVLLDIQMPPPDGMSILREILKRELRPEVVMLSGAATLQQAADSVKDCAADFIEKPPDINRLLSVVKNCCEKYALRRENIQLKNDNFKKYEIIGYSKAIHDLKDMIRQIAGTESRVLIQGETGTGKELAACQIHYRSIRARGPLVSLNCAAIPPELAESELFGHKKGAFTGAYRDKPGKFELANGGSLILDEVAELPPALQSKLLRVLESSELEVIGATAGRRVDVRLITISGKDLGPLVEQNKFRADLYYRINIIPLKIPPLRQHKEDLDLLFEHFFDKLRESSGQYRRGYDPEILPLLSAYDWPGNVRELKNYVERLFFLTNEEKISVKSASSVLARPVSLLETVSKENTEKNLLTQALNRFERNFLAIYLENTANNVSKLAEKLQMDRGNLYKKLKKYDLL